MGMTSGWLSCKSAENFIIEQCDNFDEVFKSVRSIYPVGIKGVFCIVVEFDNNTGHLLTEADVRFMTGEQSYEI